MTKQQPSHIGLRDTFKLHRKMNLPTLSQKTISRPLTGLYKLTQPPSLDLEVSGSKKKNVYFITNNIIFQYNFFFSKGISESSHGNLPPLGYSSLDFDKRGLDELRKNSELSSPEECARACREGEPPRICYYHFTAELYNVLGA